MKKLQLWTSVPSHLIIVLVTFAFCLFSKSVSTELALNNEKIKDFPRSFVIDYERNTFLKDGQPFRYISGSFHYFRSIPEYWDDIMTKFRLAGLNALQTYVEWSSHQPTPSEHFNFEGNFNLFGFLETAKKNELLVILRIGPYIDAERNMGGFPPWLLWQKLNMTLRSADLEYMYFVSRWFDHLLPRLKPYLYENGGPVIMIQVENEYGSYACSKEYPTFLRDLIRMHLGDEIILFTTDGNGEEYMKCGNLQDVYPTIDFGPESWASVNKSFEIQRIFAPKGPLVNSEYYPGWLDHWNRPHSTRTSAEVTSTLYDMLAVGANVNIYMFYGGTSFGYGAGSNIDGDGFDPCPTSYDYDAPLSEARDPQIKYFAIKDTIASFVPVPAEDPVFSPKASYGPIQMTQFSTVLNQEFLDIFTKKPTESVVPLSFEELKVSNGFVLYTTKINFLTTDPVILSTPDLHDRAFIYVNGRFSGVLGRSENILATPIQIRQGQLLSILVENQGRPAFRKSDEIGEQKGLGKIVLLGGRRLTQTWKMYKIGEIDGKMLLKYSITKRTTEAENSNEQSPKIVLNDDRRGFYVGNFTVSRNQTNSTSGYPLDTFVRLDGWTKGMIWINSFNLGRYWFVGPQQTLYLPGPLLKFSPEVNIIVVLELEYAPELCSSSFVNYHSFNCSILLTDNHIIDGPTPYPE